MYHTVFLEILAETLIAAREQQIRHREHDWEMRRQVGVAHAESWRQARRLLGSLVIRVGTWIAGPTSTETLQPESMTSALR